MTIFRKILSANDVGATGTHQSGILVPKFEAIRPPFPQLNAAQKNPDAPLKCVDENGRSHCLRFVYYNNKLHDDDGTRDEYRITHIMNYLKDTHAEHGDAIQLWWDDAVGTYRILIVRR